MKGDRASNDAGQIRAMHRIGIDLLASLEALEGEIHPGIRLHMIAAQVQLDAAKTLMDRETHQAHSS